MASLFELTQSFFPDAKSVEGAMSLDGVCREGVAVDRDADLVIDLFVTSNPLAAEAVTVQAWSPNAVFKSHEGCTPPATSPDHNTQPNVTTAVPPTEPVREAMSALSTVSDIRKHNPHFMTLSPTCGNDDILISPDVTREERMAIAIALQQATDGDILSESVLEGSPIVREEYTSASPLLQTLGWELGSAFHCDLAFAVKEDGMLDPADVSSVLSRLGLRLWPFFHPQERSRLHTLYFGTDLTAAQHSEVAEALERAFGKGPNYGLLVADDRLTASELDQVFRTQQLPLDGAAILGSLNRVSGYDETMNAVDLPPFLNLATTLMHELTRDLQKKDATLTLIGQETTYDSFHSGPANDGGKKLLGGLFSGMQQWLFSSAIGPEILNQWSTTWRRLFQTPDGLKAVLSRNAVIHAADDPHRDQLHFTTGNRTLSVTTASPQTRLSATTVEWSMAPYASPVQDPLNDPMRMADLAMQWRLQFAGEMGSYYLYDVKWTGAYQFDPLFANRLAPWQELVKSDTESQIYDILHTTQDALLAAQ